MSLGVEVPRFSAHRLKPELTALAGARRFTRRTLGSWGRTALLRDTVSVVHELVANAVCHAYPQPDGRGSIWVSLSESASGVWCTVVDPSLAPPRLLADDVLGARGRGLLIVQQLSSVWGFRLLPNESGKAVWARLPHAACSTDGGKRSEPRRAVPRMKG
ncbi:ATP-binding protein [Streptomyces sp. NPDC059071]|uniref:ATP-binding protein n=1 Tax=unclassified Streptomyces TaxID=2593676 RepID=UPI003658494A